MNIPYIGADFRWIGCGGIGRFAEEVLPRLNANRVSSAYPLFHPLDPIAQSLAIRSSRCDTYFTPGYNAPLLLNIPFCFVLHDLIHLRFRPESSFAKSAYYNLVVRPAAKRARFVLTVSEFSRREIIDWLGIAESKVVVVGNGLSSAFRPDGPSVESDPPYCVYVGARKPHKNIHRLLTAFANCRASASLELRMTGKADPQTAEMIGRLGLSGRVSFIQRLDDINLAKLYRGSRALLIPSLYEGFGLPALEAAACGVPVLASKGGALEEVLGEAATYCSPESTDSICAGIESVVFDETRRNVMVSKGVERASHYRWEAVAARVSACLRPI